MAAKTISFKKGDGHLTHNNRDFINSNVDPQRIPWNRIYIKESLEAAYEKCFGEALRNYNAAQKRKDRQKENYIKEIENSGNGEHVFYENIVQIGKMTDTPVVDENGKMTEAAKIAILVLDEYARTFQERNPNLYLFNCVMHLDEKTPHLHMDYIPVAHGYKKGMETRNSLTKAYQQMGFAKAVSKKQNETMAWQERERSYLTDLCRKRGIEIEVLGIERDDLSLPEYKEAMREVEALEHRSEELTLQNNGLEQNRQMLAQKCADLSSQVQETEEISRMLRQHGEEMAKRLKKMSAEEKAKKELLAEYNLKEADLKMVAQEAGAEMAKLKGIATPMSTLFGGEEYVKIKKSDWHNMLGICRRAITRNRLVDKYEKRISMLMKKIDALTTKADRLGKFVIAQGLEKEFEEYLESFDPKKKSIIKELEKAKVKADEHNRGNDGDREKAQRKSKDLREAI